jgi:hypothetical protein
MSRIGAIFFLYDDFMIMKDFTQNMVCAPTQVSYLSLSKWNIGLPTADFIWRHEDIELDRYDNAS